MVSCKGRGKNEKKFFNKNRDEEQNTIEGIQQGDSLSLILLNIIMNQIIMENHKVDIICHVYDAVLTATTKTTYRDNYTLSVGQQKKSILSTKNHEDVN